MRRMLDPAKVGGLPSTIEFDKDGNRKVTKNLGVGGKLTLNSLVSASNPDGDITKELGGGGGNTLYEYTAVLLDESNLGIQACGKFYSSVDIGQKSIVKNSRELYDQLLPSGAQFELILDVFGYAKITEGGKTTYYSLIQLNFGTSEISLYYLDPVKGKVKHPHNFRYDTTTIWNVIRNVASPRQAN